MVHKPPDVLAFTKESEFVAPLMAVAHVLYDTENIGRYAHSHRCCCKGWKT
jgi:hypothetical protein